MSLLEMKMPEPPATTIARGVEDPSASVFPAVISLLVIWEFGAFTKYTAGFIPDSVVTSLISTILPFRMTGTDVLSSPAYTVTPP